MMSHIFYGNAAPFHCLPSFTVRLPWLTFVIRMTPWSQLHISGHVKGHSTLRRRRAASGLDVGRPSQWRCRRCSGTASDFCAYNLWIIGLCWVYHQPSLYPVQVLKSHLRLIRGSKILDHIWTQFLGVRLIREGDLYASIYGNLLNIMTNHGQTVSSIDQFCPVQGSQCVQNYSHLLPTWARCSTRQPSISKFSMTTRDGLYMNSHIRWAQMSAWPWIQGIIPNLKCSSDWVPRAPHISISLISMLRPVTPGRRTMDGWIHLSYKGYR